MSGDNDEEEKPRGRGRAKNIRHSLLRCIGPIPLASIVQEKQVLKKIYDVNLKVPKLPKAVRIAPDQPKDDKKPKGTKKKTGTKGKKKKKQQQLPPVNNVAAATSSTFMTSSIRDKMAEISDIDKNYELKIVPTGPKYYGTDVLKKMAPFTPASRSHLASATAAISTRHMSTPGLFDNVEELNKRPTYIEHTSYIENNPVDLVAALRDGAFQDLFQTISPSAFNVSPPVDPPTSSPPKDDQHNESVFGQANRIDQAIPPPKMPSLLQNGIQDESLHQSGIVSPPKTSPSLQMEEDDVQEEQVQLSQSNRVNQTFSVHVEEGIQAVPLQPIDRRSIDVIRLRSGRMLSRSFRKNLDGQLVSLDGRGDQSSVNESTAERIEEPKKRESTASLVAQLDAIAIKDQPYQEPSSPGSLSLFSPLVDHKNEAALDEGDSDADNDHPVSLGGRSNRPFTSKMTKIDEEPMYRESTGSIVAESDVIASDDQLQQEEMSPGSESLFSPFVVPATSSPSEAPPLNDSVVGQANRISRSSPPPKMPSFLLVEETPKRQGSPDSVEAQFNGISSEDHSWQKSISCTVSEEEDQPPQEENNPYHSASEDEDYQLHQEQKSTSRVVSDPSREEEKSSLRTVSEDETSDEEGSDSYFSTGSNSNSSISADNQLHPDILNKALARLSILGNSITFDFEREVFRSCGQNGPVSWDKAFPKRMIDECVKIGEGCFGEVFRTTNDAGDSVALKVIPIEGDFEVNGETQKTFHEIFPEISSSVALSELRKRQRNATPSFIEVKAVRCVKGAYPTRLIDSWNDYHERKQFGSENESPTIFGENQLFIVFEFANGGCDLEGVKLKSVKQAESITKQLAISLAIAEIELQFEHRDLHWGNVLVKETAEKEICYLWGGERIQLASHGVQVFIIDFTNSRYTDVSMRQPICTNLAGDTALFRGDSNVDYQYDIYRKMRDLNGNEWSAFHPKTNVYWLDYLIHKLIKAKTYACNRMMTKKQAKPFTDLRRGIESFNGCCELIREHQFFEEFWGS